MTSAPVVRPLPADLRPDETAARAAGRPWSLFLDSALRDEEIGRFSFVALDPFLVLRSRRGRAELLRPGGWEGSQRSPLDELERLTGRHRLRTPAAGVPFQGGAAGYLGYELGRQLEDVPRSRWRHPDLPELTLGFYDVVLGWDHLRGDAWLVSTGRPARGAEAVDRAEQRARRVEGWLRGEATLDPQLPERGAREDAPLAARDASEPAGGRPPGLRDTGAGDRADGPPAHPVPDRPALRSTFTPGGYEDAVRRAVEYIRAGDVFQVNLSQRFTGPASGDAFGLYRRLRERNAAPFAAFMNTPACTVASASPERFLRVAPDGRVETRPIKGTRPRGRHPAHDMHLQFELSESEKDRAENLMIVDLLRNDLSRVCRPGSVRVPALFRKESYATVHHLVSVVAGRLEADRSRADLLRAAFPGGSVTGAPKIRAMEIIAELEPVCRGPYCGSIGYLGFDGSMDTSVTIRTLVLRPEAAYFHAGGGVVADSDPRREYLETLDKAAGLIEPLVPPG